MMKALTHNIQQEREDQRDRSAQLFMWCIVVSMHQDDGIGASRLLNWRNLKHESFDSLRGEPRGLQGFPSTRA